MSGSLLDHACQVAHRSTCPSRRAGAVLADAQGLRRVSGYEGAPRGAPHCDEVGCDFDERGRCVRAVRAEVNAILQAARAGICTDGAAMYMSCPPAEDAMPALLNAGIRRVITPTETIEVNAARPGGSVERSRVGQ